MKKRIIPILCVSVAAFTAGSIVIADSIKSSMLTNYSGLIDIKTAIDTAVDQTGYYSDEVYVVKAELDHEYGGAVYEVEMVTDSGKLEYDINAVDGTVIKAPNISAQQHKYGSVTTVPSETVTQESYLEAAKAAACRHAGLNPDNITIKKAKLDREDGIYVYELEFYAGDKEYDYEINTNDGSVLEYKVKSYAPKTAPAQTTEATAKLTLDESKKIAFEHAKVDEKNVRVESAKQDRENGVDVYEIEFYTSTHEYEYEINVNTGEIIKYDIEKRD